MESGQNALRSYPLALLTLMEDQADDDADYGPLGMAMRQETPSTIYRQTAHRLFKALIEHSPSPDTVAGRFLTELAKCGNDAVVELVLNLNNDLSLSPGNWAAEVNTELKENGGNITFVTNLATFFVTNLLVAFRSLPGKTPQGNSEPPTPDPNRTEEISSLLESATVRRNQAALKELVLRRDGPNCPVTGAPFDGDDAVPSQCAHIIPFSLHNKPPMLTAIEMFTGNEVTAEIIQQFINRPDNAINLQSDAHHAMDKRLAWGIEAKLVNDEWKYYFRAVKRALPIFMRHFISDGDEMNIGKGVDGSMIALPDPRLCNLHLAVARVFAASGFAEVAEAWDKDNEGSSPTNFGDDLSRRLRDVLVT